MKKAVFSILLSGTLVMSIAGCQSTLSTNDSRGTQEPIASINQDDDSNNSGPSDQNSNHKNDYKPPLSMEESREIYFTMKNLAELAPVENKTNTPIYIISIKPIFQYVRMEPGFSTEQGKQEQKLAFNATGDLAYLDLAINGDFSPFWYQLLPTIEMEERFKNEIADTIKTINSPDDYLESVEEIENYINQGDLNDHILNLKFTILNAKLNEEFSRSNTFNENSELLQKFMEMQEKIHNSQLFSLNAIEASREARC